MAKSKVAHKLNEEKEMTELQITAERYKERNFDQEFWLKVGCWVVSNGRSITNK